MTTRQPAGLRDAPTRYERTVVSPPEERWKSLSRIVACLEGPLSERLIATLPMALLVPRASQLIESVRESGADLVIADPDADSGHCTLALLQIRTEDPSLLIVAYTTLQPSVVPRLLDLARAGIQDVILYRTDDTRARFIELVERATTRPVSLSTFSLLDDALRCVPEALRAAIRSLFEARGNIRSVDDLAAAARITRRAAYRWLSAAGIQSPRLLVLAPRLLRAAMLLSQPGRTLSDVARRLGYSKPELLSMHLRAITGLRPRQLRDPSCVVLVPELIARRLVAGTRAVDAGRINAR